MGNVNMKIKILCIIGLLVVFIILYNSGVLNGKENNQETISGKGTLFYDRREDLKAVLKKTQNSDGGFREMLYIDQSMDLYTTYYSAEILEIIHSENNHVRLPSKIDITSILKDNERYDVLSDLFYLVGFYNNQLNTEDKEILIKYIKQLRNEDGSYSYSKKHRMEYEVEKKDYKDVILSTYRATDILKKLGEKIEDDDKLNNWIENIFKDDKLFDSSNILNSGYVLNLIQITKMVNYDISPYEIQLNEYAKEINEKLREMYNQKDDLDLLLINNIFNLNNNLDNKQFYSEMDSKHLIQIINDMRNKDGGFGVNKEESSDILPTYIAVNILNTLGYGVDNVGKIVKLINKLSLISGGYSPLVNMKSDLNISLFAKSILANIFPKDSAEFKGLESYLRANKQNITTLNTETVFLYLSIVHENESSKLTSTQIENIKLRIIKEIKETNELNDISSYINLLYEVEILKEISPESLKEIRQDIRKLFKVESQFIKNSDVGLLTDVIKLKIQKNFNSKTDNELNKKILEIQNLFYSGGIDNIVLFYYYIDLLVSYEVDINKSELEKQLLQYQNYEGTFRITTQTDSVSSYIATYYAIQCLKRLQ